MCLASILRGSYFQSNRRVDVRVDIHLSPLKGFSLTFFHSVLD